MQWRPMRRRYRDAGPPLDPGSGRAGGAGLTNRCRGLAAGACWCAVLTRVTLMAVSRSSTDDAAVLAVWRQSSSIGLSGPAWKTPVVGTGKVRGVPNWRFFATGVTEKMLPRELTSCIQQDTLPVAPMVAWA